MEKQKKLVWKGKEITSYREIVKIALFLKGEEQKDFVERYIRTGEYALSNMRYIAGYYAPETEQRILRIFNIEQRPRPDENI